ncbi:type-F conjugative transfer system pilin assembly protein TraF, partial [Escherichia coli EC1865]
TGHCETG